MVELSGFEKLLIRVNEESEWIDGKHRWVKKKILKEFDPATGELHSILSADDEGKILEVLADLRPREEKVLKMRFGIGQKECTHREIGKEFEITRERVRQIEAIALRKLRHPKRKKKLPVISRGGLEESYRVTLEALDVLSAEAERLSRDKAYRDQGFPAPFLSKSVEVDLSKPIGDLELSVRVRNCFIAAQPPIETIGDLVHSIEGRLLRLNKFGRKSLIEVKKALSEMGLSLGMKI